VTNLYDTIGSGYSTLRRPDPRIERAILKVLGEARRVLNVGAGTGSYEPRERFVVAVEPSRAMIRQRPSNAAPAVQASASALPFGDSVFDVSLAILTMHHWSDWRQGLRELMRVAGGNVVLLTWDPDAAGFWLVDEYFPEILAIDRQIFPSIDSIRAEIGDVPAVPLPIPHDCTDGFLGAYWRRPEQYLRPEVRRAISSFARLSSIDPGLERLRRDVESGAWRRRHDALLSRDSLDLGYRLIVAGGLAHDT
jgi:SAM-dependent methyltransferase